MEITGAISEAVKTLLDFGAKKSAQAVNLGRTLYLLNLQFSIGRWFSD